MKNNQDNEDIIKEMHSYRMKLQESFKKYEEIELKIYDISQQKIKASVELEEMKMRENMMKERLKGIHDNYLAWARKINSEESEQKKRTKIQKLTAERDYLIKRLAECKRSNDENNKKIDKLVAMIKIEKNKYGALLRKLEKNFQMKNIPQDLRDKVNAILNGPPLNDV